MIKISYSKYLIEHYQYCFRQQQLNLISKYTAGKWLSSTNTNCQLFSGKYLVCVDQAEQEFQILTLNQQGSQFNRIPLSSFGLKSDKKSKYLQLHKLPLSTMDKTVTISKTSETKQIYFSLDLGGEGFVLFRLQSPTPDTTTSGNPNIFLVKILPNAVRLTIIPLISSSSGNDASLNEFGLAVLFTKQNTIKYEDEKDAQNGEKVFAMKLVIFHLGTWDQISSMSSEQILLEFGSKKSIAPIVSNGKLVKRLDQQWSIEMFEIIPIRTTTYNSRTGRNQFRHTYKMVLGTADGTLIVLNLMGKVTWSREESLAEIVNVVMLDLPLSETDATLEQEYGFDDNKNIVSMFVHRINSQLIQLSSAIRALQNWIFSLSGKALLRTAAQSKRLEDKYEQELNPDVETSSASTDDDDVEEETFVRDYFGLHKVIMIRTKVGKLFAIDSLSGRVIWSRYDPILYLKRYFNISIHCLNLIIFLISVKLQIFQFGFNVPVPIIHIRQSVHF